MITYQNIILKLGFMFLIAFICSNMSYGQHQCVHHKSCGLELIEQNMFSKVPPPQKFMAEKDLEKSNPVASISVTYIGFGAYPDAQAAFQYAVDIWESILPFTIDIEIEAKFEALGANTLGSAGATYIYSNVPGTPVASAWIPIALANEFYGYDLKPNDPEIRARFSNEFNWYFDTDGNTPAGQIDFVSVVLHEIGHGLGISGSANYDDGVNDTASGGSNDDECNGTAGHGCLRSPIVKAYDHYVELGNGTDVRNLANPSTTLGNAITSDNLFWNSCETMAVYGSRPPIFAPTTWDKGSSFSHLDEGTFPAGNPNSLMTPQIGYAEAIHDPGTIVIAMLGDMGWQFPNCTTGVGGCTTNYVVPANHTSNEDIEASNSITSQKVVAVNLNVDYDAGNLVHLLPGFHAQPGSTFHAFNDGCGGAMLIADNQDSPYGVTDYEPAIASENEIPDLSDFATRNYPNPFTQQTTIEYRLPQDRPVTLIITDVAGKQLSVLVNNETKAKGIHTTIFNGSNYPAGMYYYTIQAGNYIETQKMTLVK